MTSGDLWSYWVGPLLAALLGGCSVNAPANKVTPDGAVVQSRLVGVRWLYVTFQAKNGRPPKHLAEINQFGQSLSIPEGGPIVLTEEYLTSPRDHKPLQIRFGLIPDAARGDEKLAAGANAPILAHESEGRDGQRFVVYLNSGNVTALTDAQFDAAMKKLDP